VKSYEYKVYDASENYLQTWTDVVTEPAHSQEINSPAVEMVVRLARNPESYGEEEDVKFNNIVKVLVKDDESTSPALFFQGYIADYTPIFGEGEGVEVVLLSFGAQLDDYIHGADETAEQSQATGSSTQGFSESTQLAQSFIPDASPITSVDLKLSVAVPTNVTLSIHTDNSGSPNSGAVSNGLVTKEVTATSLEVVRFIFATPVTITPGSTYWLVLTGG
jgi:hypothetical protein